MGITELDKKYHAHEMAQGDVMFSATGVTDGFMLRGVKHQAGCDVTHSIVMRSATGTVERLKQRKNAKYNHWVLAHDKEISS